MTAGRSDGWTQPTLPGMGKNFAQRSLNSTQFSWDQIVARHPEMAEHEDAVTAIMYGHDHEGMEGAHDLVYRYKDVDPHKVRAQESYHGRTQRAREGYQTGAKVPTPLLVRPGPVTWPADGNHRILAARGVLPTVRAVVATKK